MVQLDSNNKNANKRINTFILSSAIQIDSTVNRISFRKQTKEPLSLIHVFFVNMSTFILKPLAYKKGICCLPQPQLSLWEFFQCLLPQKQYKARSILSDILDNTLFYSLFSTTYQHIHTLSNTKVV